MGTGVSWDTVKLQSVASTRRTETEATLDLFAGWLELPDDEAAVVERLRSDAAPDAACDD